MPTDHDRIADSASTYLRGSSPALMFQSVDLIHPSVNPANQARADISLANPFFKKENGGFDCYFKTAVIEA